MIVKPMFRHLLSPIFIFLISISFFSSKTYSISNQSETKIKTANSSEGRLSNEFAFRGKPIDALCIDHLVSSDEKFIDLKKCATNIKKYKSEGSDEQLLSKGFIGLNYSIKSATEGPWGGSAYYKYLGLHNQNHVIYFIQNTGGSGMMTYIMLVELDGDLLKLKDILVSGDRCNGGIEQASLQNDKLLYTLSITPYDYITLSKNAIKIEPYDDLANCAICCQGNAELSHNFKEYELLKINLGEIPDEDASLQGKYQPCFNKLITQWVQEKRTTLTPQLLDEFVTEFKQKCFK